jgi:hypothetical protein
MPANGALQCRSQRLESPEFMKMILLEGRRSVENVSFLNREKRRFPPLQD